MKRIKCLLFILPLVFILTSCDFVKYVENSTSVNETNSGDELISLDDEKKSYSTELDLLSTESVYGTRERSLFLQYLIEAKAEIYECTTSSEIKEVYDKYSALINGLKTNSDYEKELSDMKQKYLDLINNVVSSENYEENEFSSYEEIISIATGVFNSITTANEDLFKQVLDIYKEYLLKVDALSEKKTEYIDMISTISSVENYRELEQTEYNSYLVEAINLINSITNIEDENFDKIYNAYHDVILSIKTNAQYEKEEQDLLDEKTKYIDLLNNVSSLDNYREKEQALYTFYLNAGIKAIEAVEVITNVTSTYSAYKETIENIKTDLQYKEEEALALAKYKADSIKLLDEYLDKTLYRDLEKEEIQKQIAIYTDKINDATDNLSIDNLVIDYKIVVYPLKTDKELYNEELDELISNSIVEIRDYKNKSNYRDNEVTIITSIVNSFNEQVKLLENKELVISLVKSTKENLDSIKTDNELYEEERIELVDECYMEMLTLVDMNSLDENSKNEYLEYCSNVKNEMLLLNTKEKIKSRLLNEKQNIYLIGAQLGDESSLNEYKELAVDSLYNYVDLDYYRVEQQTEILTIINSQGKVIKKQETYNDVLSKVDETHLLLDSVLTNDEMWVKEDEDFFVKLHQLFGDDILTPPASMTEANDYYELAKIIDYYAFYQLDATSFVRNKFRVKLNWEHKDASYEKNEVYWYCELIKGAVGFDAYYENDYIVFELIPYNFASISSGYSSNKIKYNWNCEYDSNASLNRSIDFTDFPYKNYCKKVVVWNSQQLWYSLENGLCPIPIDNSPAAELLHVAEKILIQIIKDDMSIKEKIYAIFQWISDNITYDQGANDFNDSHDMDNYPDENLSLLQSLHVEGGLLDGKCVCLGYAKTYLLLLRMEGIDSLLMIAKNKLLENKNTINSRDNSSGGFGYHSFVYILVDGKWFYSDSERSCRENNGRIHSYIYLLLNGNYQEYGFSVTHNVDSNYRGVSDIYESIFYDNYKTFGDSFDTLISSFSSNGLENDQICLITDAVYVNSVVDYIIQTGNLEYSLLYLYDGVDVLVDIAIIHQ